MSGEYDPPRPPDNYEAIVKKDDEAVKLWNELLKRPRDAERLGNKIEESYWWGAATRFDEITDW